MFSDSLGARNRPRSGGNVCEGSRDPQEIASIELKRALESKRNAKRDLI